MLRIYGVQKIRGVPIFQMTRTVNFDGLGQFRVSKSFTANEILQARDLIKMLHYYSEKLDSELRYQIRERMEDNHG